MLVSRTVGLGSVGSAWSTALAAFFVGLVSFGGRRPAAGPRWSSSIATAVVLDTARPLDHWALSLLTEGRRRTSAGLLAMVTAVSIDRARLPG